jgi:hypothetical protein
MELDSGDRVRSSGARMLLQAPSFQPCLTVLQAACAVGQSAQRDPRSMQGCLTESVQWSIDDSLVGIHRIDFCHCSSKNGKPSTRGVATLTS